MIELIKFILTNHLDKIAHILASYSIVITAFLFSKKLKLAIIVAFVLSLFKEFGDVYYGYHFCFYDFFANVVGIIIAIFVLTILEYKNGKYNK